jgi:hypothetical protein
MWIKVTHRKPAIPCLAFDAIGKSIGMWDGDCFDSITGNYTFDSEHSEGLVFFLEGTNKIIGLITHWAPIPDAPEKKECTKIKNTLKSRIRHLK